MCMILPFRLFSLLARAERGSSLSKFEPSPEPTQSVPSGADRTVPTMWLGPSAPMQSTELAGFGQGAVLTLPSTTVWPLVLPSSWTVTRTSREVIAPCDPVLPLGARTYTIHR